MSDKRNAAILADCRHNWRRVKLRIRSSFIAGVAVCAVLTWILPAGEYDRRDDPATGRNVVVAGDVSPRRPAPVGPFAAAVAVPRGFVAAADVIGVVLLSAPPGSSSIASGRSAV